MVPAEVIDSELVADWTKGLDGGNLTSLSTAEMLDFIKSTIEDDEENLERFGKETDDPKGTFATAEESFNRITDALDELGARLEAARNSGDGELVRRLEAEQVALNSVYEIKRERFDLIIGRRQVVERFQTLLRILIADGEIRLGAALGKIPTAVPDLVESAASSSPPSSPVPDPGGAAGLVSSPVLGLPLPASPTPSPDPEPASPSDDPVVREVQEAVEKAQLLVSGSQARIEWSERRLALNKEARDLEERLLELDRGLIANAEKAREFYEALKIENSSTRYLDRAEGLAKAKVDRASAEGLLKKAEERFEALDRRRQVVTEAIDSRRGDLVLAREKLDSAKRSLRWADSPFALRNIRQWFGDHGFNLLAILILILILLLVVRLVGRRVVHAVAHHGARGSAEERESRAHTLSRAFEQAAHLTIVVGGFLIVLDEVGIPIAPLLGGAAVFGVAIAFGAQNLIKDFFQGFMILLENQYKLNDVVEIGDHSGLVEEITLRITTLRSLDGTLHFIPNGQINVVSNMTHGWSRALFEIGVAYKEDVDRVIEVIEELGVELRRDPSFAAMIRDDLEMLGVESLGDSAVMIKFFILTSPVKQWGVKREMLRRIKRRFDELGIEIPFPQRMNYHRFDEGNPFERLG